MGPIDSLIKSVLYHFLPSSSSWAQFLEYQGQFDSDFCRLRAFAVILQELEDAEDRGFSSSDGVILGQ